MCIVDSPSKVDVDIFVENSESYQQVKNLNVDN
jgi:hypothetical protein